MSTSLLQGFLQHLYEVFCKAFRAFVQMCVAGCFTAVVKVILKGCHDMCTCVFEGFYSNCTSVRWKASAATVQVFAERLLQQLHKCLCGASTAFVHVPLIGVYITCASASCEAATAFVQVLSAGFHSTCTRALSQGVYQYIKFASAIIAAFATAGWL